MSEDTNCLFYQADTRLKCQSVRDGMLQQFYIKSDKHKRQNQLKVSDLPSSSKLWIFDMMNK